MFAGNGADGFPISYNWTLPSAEDVFRNTPEEVNELKCVLRIRYNISSGEGYNSGWLGAGAMGREVEFADSRMNGQNSPVKNDPLEDWCAPPIPADGLPFPEPRAVRRVGLGHNQSGPLRLALDTSQTGRVFQDRTHVFTVRTRRRSARKGT